MLASREDNLWQYFPCCRGDFVGTKKSAAGYLWHQRTLPFICQNKWGGKQLAGRLVHIMHAIFPLKRSWFASLHSLHGLPHLSNYSQVRVVLWVPSWRGEECRTVWKAGSMSFIFSFPSPSPHRIPKGPSVTAVALSLGLLCVEWHSKLMGKYLRLTFLCTCVTGARWPANCLCQRLTGPLLVTMKNIPLGLSPGLSHASSENKLALRSTSWKTQSKLSGSVLLCNP